MLPRTHCCVAGVFLACSLNLAGSALWAAGGAAESGTPVTGAGIATSWKFDFGPGKVGEGFTQILPTTVYRTELGYGFNPGSVVEAVDRGGQDAIRGDFCTSDGPFLFSIRLPEGNYRVTITFGDAEGESTTTVKAELRRLMLEKVRTPSGEFQTRTVMVNTRSPRIAEGRQVGLKERERTSEAAAWDDALTLEFNDARPCVCAIEVARADDVPTVYLLGDSTVCDQPSEPWNSWGQMLPRFFKPDVAVANHAESGESLSSSLVARRVEKVLGLLKPGDFVFVQFGHNDMKARGANALTDFRSNLKQLVADVRAKRATPVLITSMERKNGLVYDTLGQYPETVREVAKEAGVALVDLHAMSKVLYKALGQDLDDAFQDGTHHTNYGSYELAQCVVEGIRLNRLNLAKHIVDDFRGFDASRPDRPADFAMPASSSSTPIAPEGS